MSALPKEQDDGILQTHKNFLDGSVLCSVLLFSSVLVSREAGDSSNSVSTSAPSDGMAFPSANRNGRF